jgi:hypothetical protein
MTSNGILSDVAHAQTSWKVHSRSLDGKRLKRVVGLVGVGGRVGSSLSSDWHWPGVPLRSSVKLGSAVPPVLPAVVTTGLVPNESSVWASASTAALHFPTEAQSLLYLSQMLERPRATSPVLLAEPVDNL